MAGGDSTVMIARALACAPVADPVARRTRDTTR